MSGQHKLVCVLSCVPLRAEPNDRSEQVSQILAGESVIHLEDCDGNWFKLKSCEDGYEGFADPRHFHAFVDLPRKMIVNDCVCKRGDAVANLPLGGYVYEDANGWLLGDHRLECLSCSFESKPNTISDTALRFLGAPYHWGGRTKSGIDCSGLTQISSRLIGVDLKRDASDQALQGASISWEERGEDDLVFFENSKGKITHVGIITAELNIIHASGEVRIDKLNEEGIEHIETGEITHKFSHIQRVV